MLESICRKKRGSSCDSAGIAFLVELRRPVSRQALVPARSRAAEVIRPIALLFLGLGGRGQGSGQRNVGDFFPGFASAFHGDLLVRILQFPESYGLGNGLVDVRAHARELVLVILELFPRVGERDGSERGCASLNDLAHHRQPFWRLLRRE